jgi:hypothetical protein
MIDQRAFELKAVKQNLLYFIVKPFGCFYRNFLSQTEREIPAGFLKDLK